MASLIHLTGLFYPLPDPSNERGRPRRTWLTGLKKRFGDPGRIRTCDLRIRSPLLYPAELRDRSGRLQLTTLIGAGVQINMWRPAAKVMDRGIDLMPVALNRRRIRSDAPRINASSG